MSYKVDLHTHSRLSPDGGVSLATYRYFLQHNLLDCIAITDHNTVEAALIIKAKLEGYGQRIIVGEEITTTQGEIIGLYLQQTISPGQSLADTIAEIKKQGGLVYVPHPFETVRSGVDNLALTAVAEGVDIVETWNGRAIFQNKSREAGVWAKFYAKPGAASSDAHGRFGWGHTYSLTDAFPTRENLIGQLTEAAYSQRTVGVGIVYPKLNRLTKKVKTKIRGHA